MPDSVREQVLSAFATAMGATRNGRGVGTALYDGVDTIETQYFGKALRNLPVRLDYVYDLSDAEAASGPLTQQRGNAMLAECLEAANQDTTLGGLCDSVVFESAEPQPREPGSKKLPLVVNFIIRYVALNSDPYMSTEA